MQIIPDGFDNAFVRVIDAEGGYVNHRDDPGGETKHGISKRSYPRENISALTLDRAKFLYRRDFWQPAGCDRFPEKAAFDVFDAAVNHGVDQAVKFAQRALRVKDDGVIGPVTLAAISNMDPAVFSARFNGERLRFYTDLGNFGVFGKGWVRRVAENLRTA